MPLELTKLLHNYSLADEDYQHLKQFFKGTLSFYQLTDLQKTVLDALDESKISLSVSILEKVETLKDRLLRDRVMTDKDLDNLNISNEIRLGKDFKYMDLKKEPVTAWDKRFQAMFEQAKPQFGEDMKKLPLEAQQKKFRSLLEAELRQSDIALAKEWRDDHNIQQQLDPGRALKNIAYEEVLRWVKGGTYKDLSTETKNLMQNLLKKTTHISREDQEKLDFVQTQLKNAGVNWDHVEMVYRTFMLTKLIYKPKKGAKVAELSNLGKQERWRKMAEDSFKHDRDGGYLRKEWLQYSEAEQLQAYTQEFFENIGKKQTLQGRAFRRFGSNDGASKIGSWEKFRKSAAL